MPEDAIAPLPDAPAGTRWVPIDVLQPGDRILDISEVLSSGLRSSTREGTLLEKLPVDELRARIGAPRGTAQDLGCWVRWSDGDGLYAHAVHMVSSEDATIMAAGTDHAPLLFTGVVRLALARA